MEMEEVRKNSRRRYSSGGREGIGVLWFIDFRLGWVCIYVFKWLFFELVFMLFCEELDLIFGLDN